MTAYEKSERAQYKFDKFIYQLKPKTKTLARKLERILIKLCRQNVFYYLIIHAYKKDCCLTTHTCIYMETNTHVYIYLIYHNQCNIYAIFSCH